ncbi:hypothetical protein [Alicyclobacillus mengziensis]|uniref:Uncharacterized protein n=1 Tax=Alicyclobacillus mengziensis TaxID=2931921 RepID=A0A9X7VZP6_9BACL|nr:hypothetical protein [Alicyclobacillus mengziensis]QSO47755.1 hypothetical protein JZ786_01510 [Alicyclobacillus mengziensis]
MRKRRSTVYVSPGKDVTLYVPADTPREVIDYLNHLKDEGQFSQGVMDILIESITGKDVTQFVPKESATVGALDDHDAALHDQYSGTSKLERVPTTSTDPPESIPEPTQQRSNFHLRMADIFRQAQKNTSKLADDTED